VIDEKKKGACCQRGGLKGDLATCRGGGQRLLISRKESKSLSTTRKHSRGRKTTLGREERVSSINLGRRVASKTHRRTAGTRGRIKKSVVVPHRGKGKVTGVQTSQAITRGARKGRPSFQKILHWGWKKKREGNTGSDGLTCRGVRHALWEGRLLVLRATARHREVTRPAGAGGGGLD